MWKFFRFVILLSVLIPSAAFGQCNGVFPGNTLCGNLGASPAPPGPFSASGTVVGPGSSTIHDLPYWVNTGGTQLGDSGIASSSVVTGPVSSTLSHIATWNNTSGTALTDPPTTITTGQNIILNNLYVGGGRPWIDVKSGANGCAAAVGNGTADDTAAIQCQITYNDNNIGGKTFFPCGDYKISSTLTVSTPQLLAGENRYCATITTNNANIMALNFYNASAQQGGGGGIDNLQIMCDENTSANTACVEVDDFVGLTFSHYTIVGGCWSLYFNGSRGIIGGDNSSFDALLSEFGIGSTCASLYEYNSGNWFIDSKIDTIGQSSAVWAVQILTDTNALSSVLESHFDGHLDMSGTYASGSLNLADTGASRSTVVMVHPIFGASGGFGTLARFNTLSLVGAELGTGTVTDSDSTGGTLIVSGSMAGNGASGQTITFAGTHLTRSCAANSGVTC